MLLEFDLRCEYLRERKKRGKPSRKVLAERAAAEEATSASSPSGAKLDDEDLSDSTTFNTSVNECSQSHRSDSMSSGGPALLPNDCAGGNILLDLDFSSGQPAAALGQFDGVSSLTRVEHSHHIPERPGVAQPMAIDDFSDFAAATGRRVFQSENLANVEGDFPNRRQHDVRGFQGDPYGLIEPNQTDVSNSPWVRVSDSPLLGYHAYAPTSSGWQMPLISLPSPFQTQLKHDSLGYASLKYPVLLPLLPYIFDIISIELACDLLDFYFASSSSAGQHPISPWILASVLRRQAILDLIQPRKCQPALLASMIWVAAQKSEAPPLKASPLMRDKICERLLALIVRLLNPYIHTASSQVGATVNTSVEPSLSGLGARLSDAMNFEAALGFNVDGASAFGQFDNLLTYVQMATVASANEYTRVGLRWWNLAWSSARELKLGHEWPPGEHRSTIGHSDAGMGGPSGHHKISDTSLSATEEDREERRRAWWLIYLADRHLALCYNRPLFLLDVECEGLRQPLDDAIWQSGDFKSHLNNFSAFGTPLYRNTHNSSHPAAGARFEFRSQSVFGHFLPLMTILGEIVNLQHARNHSRFGVAFSASLECSNRVSEIRSHLAIYEKSLQHGRPENTQRLLPGDTQDLPSAHDGFETARSVRRFLNTTTETPRSGPGGKKKVGTKSQAALAYGDYIVHVLHILLEGKWDPIELLRDDDGWTTTADFTKTLRHAVAAAECINRILELDPGLQLMPSFFAVYLLQGSFILLLYAERFRLEPAAISACEATSRAFEASVTTLSNEYQVRVLFTNG